MKIEASLLVYQQDMSVNTLNFLTEKLLRITIIMLRCGITGSTGNLGKTLLKIKNFISLNLKEILQKINRQMGKKNNFDILIHLAAIVSTREVNYNYKKALK